MSDFDALPRSVYGMKMPTSASLLAGDRMRREVAKAGSEALLAAIGRCQDRARGDGR